MADEDAQQQARSTSPSSLASSPAEAERLEGAVDMESNREAQESLLPREVDARSEISEGGTAAAGRGGSYRTAAKSLIAIFLLIGVIAFVSYTAGRNKQKDADGPGGNGDRWGPGRALEKLTKPTVILISADGFRWTYNFKAPTPNIDRLRLNGTEAGTGLIPVFPSLTFPNHYSIATGLYPAWHGVIANCFSDPDFQDPRGFYQDNIDPKWWGGEPIWVTATKNGMRAATYFWPGSEVPKSPWTCDPAFCQKYNGSVPYEDRVDKVLSYMDLPLEEVPSFISLYFESPDHEGHGGGPDSPQVAAGIQVIDSLIGRLIVGLERRGLFQDVSIILVGDHGMAPNCDGKMIYLQDFGLGPDLDFDWVDSYGGFLSIRPPHEVDSKRLYLKMVSALASGKVENSKYLELYLKEDLPARLLYSNSSRIQPIIGLPAEGFKVGFQRAQQCGGQCGGQHGYDNLLLSMRSIFIGHGPQFGQGRVVPSFVNVEIYNVITAILGIEHPAVNNGTAHFASSVLLPPSS